MNNLMSSNEITMGTREISTLLKKNHSDIKRSAERLQAAQILTQPLAGSNFNHCGNEYTEYLLNKRDSLILVAQNSPEFLADVIDRWQELENNQHKIPQTFGEALQLAANQAVQIEDQQKQLTQQAPAVEFVDNYTKAESGSKGFRETAKLLSVKENVFRKFLTDNKIMYKLGGNWTAHQTHVDCGRFEVVTGENNGHIHNTTKFTAKGITWIAGEYAKSKVGESK